MKKVLFVIVMVFFLVFYVVNISKASEEKKGDIKIIKNMVEDGRLGTKCPEGYYAVRGFGTVGKCLKFDLNKGKRVKYVEKIKDNYALKVGGRSFFLGQKGRDKIIKLEPGKGFKVYEFDPVAGINLIDSVVYAEKIDTNSFNGFEGGFMSRIEVGKHGRDKTYRQFSYNFKTKKVVEYYSLCYGIRPWYVNLKSGLFGEYNYDHGSSKKGMSMSSEKEKKCFYYTEYKTVGGEYKNLEMATGGSNLLGLGYLNDKVDKFTTVINGGKNGYEGSAAEYHTILREYKYEGGGRFDYIAYDFDASGCFFDYLDNYRTYLIKIEQSSNEFILEKSGGATYSLNGGSALDKNGKECGKFKNSVARLGVRLDDDSVDFSLYTPIQANDDNIYLFRPNSLYDIEFGKLEGINIDIGHDGGNSGSSLTDLGQVGQDSGNAVGGLMLKILDGIILQIEGNGEKVNMCRSTEGLEALEQCKKSCAPEGVDLCMTCFSSGIRVKDIPTIKKQCKSIDKDDKTNVEVNHGNYSSIVGGDGLALINPANDFQGCTGLKMKKIEDYYKFEGGFFSDVGDIFSGTWEIIKDIFSKSIETASNILGVFRTIINPSYMWTGEVKRIQDFKDLSIDEITAIGVANGGAFELSGLDIKMVSEIQNEACGKINDKNLKNLCNVSDLEKEVQMKHKATMFKIISNAFFWIDWVATILLMVFFIRKVFYSDNY